MLTVFWLRRHFFACQSVVMGWVWEAGQPRGRCGEKMAVAVGSREVCSSASSAHESNAPYRAMNETEIHSTRAAADS